MLTSDFLMVKAMLSPSQSLQYQKESVERVLTCANCGQKLHVLEVHVCSDCCSELMSDPNSSMYEEEDDG
ncbi:protein ninF [Escherichia coli]|nr:protein ninF [Escherichia coli]